MDRRVLISTMLVLLLALAGCGQHEAEAPVEQAAADTATGETGEAEAPDTAAWEAMLAEIRTVETGEEKIPILKKFVENNPNNENTAYALSGVIHYLGDNQEAREEALRFSRELLEKVTDADVRREIQMELLGLYGSMGDAQTLKAAAEEMAGSTPLGFAEHDRVTEAALECEAWELATTHARAGLEMADAATFRNDYPKRTFTDDEVDEAVRKRKASTMASMGWALAHLDQVDKALAVFEEGSKSVTRNYVGIPESPLFSYWGRTLAEAGNNEQAVEVLAADAVLGGDVEAMDALHGAYTAMNGEAGFKDYLGQTRERLAVQVDDFTLNNYQGEPLTLSQLKGQVVLLSFWFPT